MGPFYCPLDEHVYMDLGFYEELKQKFGASGDFAQAYVLAHELGHHVQHLMGTDDRVRQLQEQRPDQANELSVRLELQADCYAGVWANSTNQRQILEAGDVDEALTAAAAVGDDRIQARTTGRVNVDSYFRCALQKRSDGNSALQARKRRPSAVVTANPECEMLVWSSRDVELIRIRKHV